ncbi:MAG: hypothetical protein WAT20_05505 [Ferruginibacter sp.]|nr:hypothetical protein [Chitinophagaceae bacterium]
MSVNLIKTIQENLGYPELKKIDPASEQPVTDVHDVSENKFSQAAIPAVLTAMYRYAQSDEGAAAVLNENGNTNWVSRIFDDHSKDAIQTISVYAHQSNEDPAAKMNAIANEAVKVTKENLAADAGIKEVKLFFSDQRNHILLYLPTELRMGELLDDNTLDDNTNKMEGPISSLMQSIGSAFSKPVTGDDIKEQ